MAQQQTNPLPGGSKFKEFGRRVDNQVATTQDTQVPQDTPGYIPSRENLDLNPTINALPGRATASTRRVNANELATTQLDRILATDSPLRRRAMQQGIDYAASRGLVNSSIAGGNAVGSLIDRAVPLAQFDASQYGTAARDNQSARNQISLFNASESGRGSRFNAGAENTFRNLIAAGKINTFERLGAQDYRSLFQQNQNDFDSSMRQMDRDLQSEGYGTQERLGILRAITQARTNESNIIGQGALSIYQDPNLTAGQQNEAVLNFATTTRNIIFNGLVDQFPDLPSLFPAYFGG